MVTWNRRRRCGRIERGRNDGTAIRSAAPVPLDKPYNDPYFGLQRGCAAMDTTEAQRWSRGRGVRVALVDTGIDAAHPDLQGRVASQRDFVGAEHAPSAAERHGTQPAGVIAAGANNRVGARAGQRGVAAGRSGCAGLAGSRIEGRLIRCCTADRSRSPVAAVPFAPSPKEKPCASPFA